MVENPNAERGDSKQNPKNIMFSERVWIVPFWMKSAMVFSFFLLIVGLVAFSIEKRETMARLAMDNVLEPELVTAGMAPSEPFHLTCTRSCEQSFDKSQTSLDAYRGQWVLLNLWATWCKPCREEMPALEMLQRHFSGRMEILAISVDDDFSAIPRFFSNKNREVELPSLLIGHDPDKRIAQAFGSEKFPVTFLINPDGQVVTQFIGPKDWFSVGSVNYFEEVLSARRSARPIVK